MSRAVHPHVCGVYSSILSTLLSTCGSSPRVWGLHTFSVSQFAELRFIPTCVGFTAQMALVGFHLGGSSPRVWGLQQHIVYATVHLRFIPTCVGFTIACTCARAPVARFIPTCVGFTFFPARNAYLTAVHPHVCGVYVVEFDIKGFFDRFIPTCVGFTGTLSHIRKDISWFIPTCVGFTLKSS